MRKNILSICILSMGFVHLYAQTPTLKIVNDSIIYNTDGKGNRVVDFSYCGYKNSEAGLPDFPQKVFVSHMAGDNSVRIQKAIDYVSSLKPDKNGIRGAVLIGEGEFEISRSLRISASGVLLRGMSKKKSILKKTGVDRGALVYLEGVNDHKFKDTLSITSGYIPVNSFTIEVSDASSLKAGDNIVIVRPATKEWIESLGCTSFGGGISALGWKDRDLTIKWNRIVSRVDGNRITVDAPITMALERQTAASYIVSYDWNGVIAESGVTNLTLVSEYDLQNKKDEDHCWTGISIDNARDCFVSNIDFRHFAGSAVVVQRNGSCITIQDCISREPVSELGGMRRQTFKISGEQILVQRCVAEDGINDFITAYGASGPIAFVQCETRRSNGISGSIGSYLTGLLFDLANIEDNDLSLKNLGQDKNGVGWNSANSVIWQSTAAGIDCYSPSLEAQNSAYGCWGQFSGDGHWAESNNHIRPRSLFYYQLGQRLGKIEEERSCILPLATTSTSSPTVEQAEILARQSLEPRLQLAEWIERIHEDNCTIPSAKILSVDNIKADENSNSKPRANVFAINGGVLSYNGKAITGTKHDVQWWSGNLKDHAVSRSKIHVTRFVPDQEGKGFTDRIDSVIADMKSENIAAFDHNYGLWYDRRRDDHSRVTRKDGDVWAPFYDQPFARSGEGRGADGLSKYDLTKPNRWYWSRLRELAINASADGKLLYHQNYFQHNILEAGAHWVDSPWRSLNNINNTGFAEPVNFSGDKRIFVADEFYDITHPVRRELHRGYIRMCLDNFADMTNVVQFLSAEYTGPAHFVRFWLDVIREWKEETGKNATIALSTTKDVQDEILGDPGYSALIDIIDIRYWHYKTDGLYAPLGGKNLAPRQHARKMKVGKVTYAEAYKAVSDYRKQYPDKAVTYYAQNYSDVAWGVFMAGGSCSALNDKKFEFLRSFSMDGLQCTQHSGYDLMVNSDNDYIIYSNSDSDVKFNPASGIYSVYVVNKDSGKIETLYKKLRISDNSTSDISILPHKIYYLRKI